MRNAYVLVLISAALHAYWNFLLKRAGGGTAFVALSKLAEVALFAPFFVIAARGQAALPLGTSGALLLISVGAVLTLGNYAALALAYRTGDLSTVYPVSRGVSLLLLPLLGLVVFHEHIDARGAAGLTLILIGLYLLRPASRESVAVHVHRSAGAVVYACLAGAAAAGYTIWDKRAVSKLPAFIYFYSYTVIVAVVYVAFVLARLPRVEIANTWKSNRLAIIQVGCFNTVAYLLVLFALRAGTSSYVIGMRQVSIVFGLLLGGFQLGERLPRRTQLGAGSLVAGCLLVAIAH